MKLYQCFYLRIVLLLLALSYSLSAAQKPTTTVAAIQLHSAHTGNFQKMHELVKEAKMQGADLAIFPEAAARYLGNPFVIGVNATGPRNYGRFLPSEYCGMSAYSTPSGEIFEAVEPFEELVLFQIDKPFDDDVHELAPTHIQEESLQV